MASAALGFHNDPMGSDDTDLVPRSESAPLTELGEIVGGRYGVVAQLGRGGMGRVFHVVDLANGQQKALKRLRQGTAASPLVASLFEREYRTLVGLRHPRIIQVFEYGVDRGTPYYTMELLDGQNLADAGLIPWRRACRHLRDIATSLALLHARRLLHRDLKPSNVRLTDNGDCKLLDFGALAPFGVSREIVGTLQYLAPEILLHLPADQRADLYSLGTVAYRMLTGHDPFRTRRLEDFPKVWHVELAPPSNLADGIPKELDELVIGLLRRDPIARPESAAEVIDRLNSMARLESEQATEELAQSFLFRSAFVGRKHELNQWQARIKGLESESAAGAAIVIEAEPGMGRSRLLFEVVLQAQLAGVTTVHLEAGTEGHRGGFLGALVARLLEAIPATTCGAHGCSKDVLAILARETVGRNNDGWTRRSGAVSGPHGGQLPERVLRWLCELSEQSPLVLAVDDVHQADDIGLAFLRGFAQETCHRRLFLVTTQRTGAETEDSVGLRLLRAVCERHTLHGLNLNETLELIRTVFGSAPNVNRLAEWVHAATDGRPQFCIDFVRYLVDQGIARYVDGMWVLPVERPEIPLPTSMEEILAVRVRSLSNEAVALAETLSLHQGPFTAELCQLMVLRHNNVDATSVLRELVRYGVLRILTHEYTFTSSSVRDLFSRRPDEATRKRYHIDLAEALVESNTQEDTCLAVEAGWHFLRAGEKDRAAQLLAAADVPWLGRDGTVTAALVHALEETLALYRRQNKPAIDRMPLTASLAQASYFKEHRLASTYGDESLELLEDISGLRLVRRLRRFLGRRLGLVIGLAIAHLRLFFAAANRRRYTLHGVYGHLLHTVTTLSGTAALSMDGGAVRRYASVVEPLTALSKYSAATGIYHYCLQLAYFANERLSEAWSGWARMIRDLGDPKCFRGATEKERNGLLLGAQYAVGVLEALRGSDAALRHAEQLDDTGQRLYAMVANQLRTLYHAFRGELDQADVYRRSVELHAIEMGSAWQVEIWEPLFMAVVHIETGNVVGLKRVIEQIETLVAQVPSLGLYSHLCRAGYAYIQGRFEESIQMHESLLAGHEAQGFLGWGITTAHLAASYNALGNHEKAKAICEKAVAHLSDADRSFAMLFIHLDIELALAEAGLGQFDDAEQRLDRLLEKNRPLAAPFILGVLHHASARVALAHRNHTSFAEHHQQAGRWFRATGAPGLMGRWAQLGAIAMGVFPAPYPPSSDADYQSVNAELRSLRDPKRRAHRALEIIRQQTGGDGGYLFRAEHGSLELVAQLQNDGPPEDLLHALKTLLAPYRRQFEEQPTRLCDAPTVADSDRVTIAESAAATVVVESSAEVGHGQTVVSSADGLRINGYYPLVLRAAAPSRRFAIAIAAVDVGDPVATPPSEPVLSAIADNL